MTDSARTVLVLGASGVLGSHLASGLSGEGYRVIGTASSADSLDRMPSQVDERLVVDLTSETSCANLINQVSATCTTLDGIVVASGVVGFGTAESTPSAQAAKIMAINHLGPAQIITGLFPLLQTGNAFVLGITGVVVEQTFPGMSAYTASKSAHSAFLQVLAKEWRRYKIAAIDVHLGHTETGLASRPLFGTAPALPTGHTPNHAAEVMLAAIRNRTAVVPSTAF